MRVPADCTFLFLQKILSNKLEHCSFENVATGSLCLCVQFKCLRRMFEHESDEEFPFRSHAPPQSEWMEIPDDYLRMRQPLSAHRFVELDTDDFLLVRAKERSSPRPLAATSAATAPPRLSMDAVQVGDIIDAQDQQQRWYQAVVISKSLERLLMHFIGWSSRWNEWVADSRRIAVRFAFTHGAHATHADTPTAWNDDADAEADRRRALQNECELIAVCSVSAAFCFASMASLNFASLRNEREHRDIALRCMAVRGDVGAQSESLCDASDAERVRVHRCVLSLWSPSLRVLCDRGYGMRDCDAGVIALPTSDAAVVDCFADWLYLAPSERIKVADSRLSGRLCVAQLMALFALSELHCVDELSFIAVQMMSAKLSVAGGLRSEHWLPLKRFIAVHRRARRERDTFKLSRLRRTFLCAVRSADLTQCRKVLRECARNKAKARALDVDEKAVEVEDERDEKVEEEEEEEEGDGDGLCADDAVWILTNIGDGAGFAAWFRFALEWLFAEATDEWFLRFAAKAKWKGVLSAWWVFAERRRTKTAHAISAQCMRSATETVHGLLVDDVFAAKKRVTEEVQSQLFEWLLCLSLNQWEQLDARK